MVEVEEKNTNGYDYLPVGTGAKWHKCGFNCTIANCGIRVNDTSNYQASVSVSVSVSS